MAEATHSVRVQRVLQAPRQAVYAAFLDLAGARMRHFAPDQAPGHPMEVVVHHADPRVGGAYSYSMVATAGPAPGKYTMAGNYVELRQGERIVMTQWTESEGRRTSPVTTVAITFEDADGGTRVGIVHEGIPGADWAESARRGWSEALENLAAAWEADG